MPFTIYNKKSTGLHVTKQAMTNHLHMQSHHVVGVKWYDTLFYLLSYHHHHQFIQEAHHNQEHGKTFISIILLLYHYFIFITATMQQSERINLPYLSIYLTAFKRQTQLMFLTFVAWLSGCERPETYMYITYCYQPMYLLTGCTHQILLKAHVNGILCHGCTPSPYLYH